MLHAVFQSQTPAVTIMWADRQSSICLESRPGGQLCTVIHCTVQDGYINSLSSVWGQHWCVLRRGPPTRSLLPRLKRSYWGYLVLKMMLYPCFIEFVFTFSLIFWLWSSCWYWQDQQWGALWSWTHPETPGKHKLSWPPTPEMQLELQIISWNPHS